MINYMLADLRRVVRKKSFWYTFLGYIALFLLMIFIFYNANFDATAYVSKTDTFLGFWPLIIGLVLFLSIYYDDFKSKAMQVAIGYGISRNKVVLAKIIETMLLSLLLAVMAGVVMCALPLLLGLGMTVEQNISLVLELLVETLRIIGYTSMATVLVYATQNAMTGTIVYVLLASKTVLLVLSMLLGQEFVVSVAGDLTKYLYSVILYGARANLLQTGGTGWLILPALIVYIAMPTVLAMLLFRKKELEF